ncbi:MAG: HAMP domain-containing histidine kinase [Magnetococcus sp. THC-1_WYH]
MVILIYDRFAADAAWLVGILTEITSLELHIHVCAPTETLDDCFSQLRPHVVFVSATCDDGASIQVMNKYVLLNPRSAFILLIGTETEHLLSQGLKMGIYNFLMKETLSHSVLEQTIREVTARKNQELALLTRYKDLEILVFERVAELWAAKELAQGNNVALSDFLNEISHELRTPMHAVLSFAELGLAQTSPQDPTWYFLFRIQQSGQHLTTLLDRLLDLAKLESGKVEFNFQLGNILDIVRIAESRLSSLLSCHHLILDVVPPDVPTHAVFDHDKMVQVVINLLGNAIKFSPPGSRITFYFSQKILPNGRVGSILNLHDSGPGISEEDAGAIFNKFVQGKKNRNKTGGTGLGLAICREIVAAHQGGIWATTHPDGGALFSVWLPEHFDAPPK